MTKNTTTKKRGFALLEIVIGASLISLVFFSLISVLNISFQLMKESTKSIQSAFLLEEGIEAIKIIRDSSWEDNIKNLNTETTYYLNFFDNTWNATSSNSNSYIDEFERSFVVEDVYRDVADDIVESGGVLDENTKKFTTSVSWFNGKSTTTKSMSAYLTNFYGI